MELKDIENMQPWLMRIVKETGRGINRFKMIEDGDKVLLAISGGKDSLALAFTLAVRRRWLPIHYDLHALRIDWNQYPMPDSDAKKMEEFFDMLEIPYEVEHADMFPPSFKGEFNCYLCARNRKRMLFDKAAELGYKKIATGHHMDDVITTTLINLCYRGNFSTMMPVQQFFGGKLTLIRPMCMVYESKLRLMAERLGFPVYNTGCPYKSTNMRLKMKPIVAELSRDNRRLREHIFEAPWNINPEYLPTDLGEDE